MKEWVGDGIPNNSKYDCWQIKQWFSLNNKKPLRCPRYLRPTVLKTQVSTRVKCITDCRGSYVEWLQQHWIKYNISDGVMAVGDCWSLLYLQLRQWFNRNHQSDVGNCHWSDCRYNLHVQRYGSRSKCHWKQRRLYSHYVYVALKRFRVVPVQCCINRVN